MTGVDASVGSWLAGGIVLSFWVAVLGALFMFAQQVTFHERAHFWCRRWAHAALPALLLGCVFFLLTANASWGVAVFLLVWTLSERGTRPIASSVDKKPPREPRFPRRGPMC